MKRQISNLAGLDQSSRTAQKRYLPKRKTKDTSVATLKKEMFRLKKQMLVAKPPVKSVMGENVLSAQNDWIGIGILYPKLGGGNDERLGNQIQIKSINIRALFKVAESDNFDNVRFVLVQFLDNNTEANYPYGSLNGALEKVFYNNSTDYPINIPYNTQTTQSYRVLYDEVFCLSAQGVESVHKNILLTSKDLAVSKLVFETAESDNNLPGLNEGLIVGFFCSDSAATPNPSMTYTVKLNFTDT